MKGFTPHLKTDGIKNTEGNRFLDAGFTLVETLIGIVIFMIISTAIYVSYSSLLDTFSIARTRSAAIAVLESEIEIARNIPYPDVGLKGGAPSGNLAPEKTVSFGGASFLVKTSVKNIDDVFDGILGGSPADAIPADYKLVEIEVSCASSCRMSPVKMTTTVAPKNLEKATKNGSLFVTALNASGEPVGGANVSIADSSLNPAININDTTNSSGSLNFVDIATSSAGYRITITKSGYSTDRTYPVGGAGNPNPTKPDAMVKEQELTKVSFAVDLLSILNFKAQDQLCRPLAGIDFKQTGEKLIGVNPDTPKYSVVHQTDSAGLKSVASLEWDTYGFSNQDADYEVSGSSPWDSVVVDPAGTSETTWLMESKKPFALLVTVIDEDDQLVDDASVRLTKSGFDQTKITGRKFFSETDWSNGNYTSKTDSVNTDSLIGEITLGQIGGKYATASQELISKTIDFGKTDTVFYNLFWNPTAQPPQTGADSLKFQIATNNDNATWNFIGPNGTTSTYYTSSGTAVHSGNNGKRYLRYKIFLQTANDQFTPKLEDLKIEFKSSCIPSGQVYFDSLIAGTYTITAEKSGYDTFSDDAVSILESWQGYEAILTIP
ncbi:MAG: prepilin-type N-terminal cleavage/methylation domain-containing protein [bacterium]|nr:prepilin-type N-terminal cleavage/methylation domain-containing protein [bacterium]